MNEKPKDKTTALLLSIFLGGLGIDRFYLGYTGIGILKLLTAGCFGILGLIDIIRIATGALQPANGIPYGQADLFEPAPVRTVPQTNPYEELEKLAKLHEQGVVNDEEFAKMKADILAKM